MTRGSGPRGPAPTGHPGTRLVVLRGNSGAGKSSIAREVRRRHGRGLALVEQDYLRRIVLRERDVPGGNAAGLVETVTRFALDAGHHVLCEGILAADRYGDMLHRLVRDHAGRTTVHYLEVPLAETLRRHAGRPQAGEFTADDVRGWYRPHDLLGVEGEQVIDGRAGLDDVVRRILAELGSG
ncbi:kinase [Pseudonocardia sp. HH130630-07]|uniref:kinase n=1 Tax=Pseudonocardia sp. HH130630-07 TaxID=1690815 RepID=UPI000814EA7E|nr:kinase [Pseudonocardia sp. HH130630-07]ANY09540.1 kinase [Pseudonocardia sp. HH130630-07]